MSKEKQGNIIKIEESPEQQRRPQYACECGKSYLNYPALYLHFRRKHNQIISTKLENENYRISKNGPNEVITYLLGVQEEQEIQIDPVIRHWEELIDQFMKIQLSGNSLGYSAKECLDNLKTYIKTLKESAIHSTYDAQKKLPLFFNTFMILHRELKQAYYRRWCQTIIKLTNWLNANNHSIIVLDENEEFLKLLKTDNNR